MKYKVTLNNRVYEVEVEQGEAMLVNEYELAAPAAAAPAAPAAAPVATKSGTVAQINVTKGAVVETGTPLVIIA